MFDLLTAIKPRQNHREVFKSKFLRLGNVLVHLDEVPHNEKHWHCNFCLLVYIRAAHLNIEHYDCSWPFWD